MQIFAIACTAMVTVGTYYGLGRSKHIIDNPSDLAQAIKYTVIAPTLCLVSTSFGKVSALIFLVRLMGLAAPRWQIVTAWAVCGIMVASNILGVVVTIGFCSPVAKQWEPSLEGWCMSTQVQYDMSPRFPMRVRTSFAPSADKWRPFQNHRWLRDQHVPCLNGYHHSNLSRVANNKIEN